MSRRMEGLRLRVSTSYLMANTSRKSALKEFSVRSLLPVMWMIRTYCSWARV